MANDPFPKVKEAREILKQRAAEIIEKYLNLAAEAQAAGDRKVAAEMLWRLIQYMPNQDGERILDAPPAEKGQPIQTGPQIQIGIKLSNEPKSLPAIDSSKIDDTSN